MKRKQHKNQSATTPHNFGTGKPAVTKQSDHIKEEHNNTNSESKEHTKEYCHHPNITIGNVDDKWTKYNKTAVVAVAINTLILVATGFIWCSGHKSAKAAEDTFSEVKKEFVLSNRPLLFMSSIRIDTLKIGRKNTYTIYFNNYGKVPIYIDSIKGGMSFNNKPSLDTFIYEPDNIREVNMFTPTNDSLRWPGYIIPFDSSALGFIKSLNIFPFIYGEISYYDLTNKQRGQYQYCFRFFWDGRFIPTPNHNGIIEGKDSLMLK